MDSEAGRSPTFRYGEYIVGFQDRDRVTSRAPEHKKTQRQGGVMNRTLASVISVLAAVATLAGAQQRRQPEVFDTIDGDPVYRLLEVGGIPAIDNPDFVSGEAADDQMRPEEPVIGVVMGDEVRAYSLWQLDAHEIVNDSMKGNAIAVTW